MVYVKPPAELVLSASRPFLSLAASVAVLGVMLRDSSPARLTPAAPPAEGTAELCREARSSACCSSGAAKCHSVRAASVNPSTIVLESAVLSGGLPNLVSSAASARMAASVVLASPAVCAHSICRLTSSSAASACMHATAQPAASSIGIGAASPAVGGGDPSEIEVTDAEEARRNVFVSATDDAPPMTDAPPPPPPLKASTSTREPSSALSVRVRTDGSSASELSCGALRQCFSG
mmetsp:Transcript_38503/g.106274  ORF Transcript_38503/g.106274 Transcript_38503/m.106274 type:complete len:235 (+) Transcript_38503:101-805(+)